MDALVEAKKGDEWSDTEGFLGTIPEGLGLNGDAQANQPAPMIQQPSPPSRSPHCR